MLAVVEQVHARINIPVFNLGVVGNVGAPLIGVVADKVVTLAWQLFQPYHLRHWVAANELHSNHGACGGLTILRIRGRQRCAPFIAAGGRDRFAQDQHCLCRGQEQSVAAPTGEKLHLRIDLALVGFKAEGQIAVSGHNLLRARVRLLLRSVPNPCRGSREVGIHTLSSDEGWVRQHSRSAGRRICFLHPSGSREHHQQ